ncbi:MAG: S4 domain-containing protein, partial [Thermoguttaceae bacterium]|nr:S4 domain-containing protein [Thermoguttaceae bacterium]
MSAARNPKSRSNAGRPSSGRSSSAGRSPSAGRSSSAGRSPSAGRSSSAGRSKDTGLFAGKSENRRSGIPSKQAAKLQNRQDREEFKAALKRTQSVFDRTTVARDAQDDDSFRGHRLQKILAAAGFGSRRQCEELITTGRVDVDGKVVSELGVRVFPMSQKIRVDGEELRGMKPVYVVVNKPRGILCTNRDQQGRRRAIDLLPVSLG